MRWQWTGGAPADASPILAALAGARQLITQSRTHVVGVGLDGALLWTFPSRHPTIRTPLPLWRWATWSSTPACRTATAVRIVKSGATYSPQEVWKNTDVDVVISIEAVAGHVCVGPASTESPASFFAIQ